MCFGARPAQRVVEGWQACRLGVCYMLGVWGCKSGLLACSRDCAGQSWMVAGRVLPPDIVELKLSWCHRVSALLSKLLQMFRQQHAGRVCVQVCFASGLWLMALLAAALSLIAKQQQPCCNQTHASGGR
jgi:hypothetical protein